MPSKYIRVSQMAEFSSFSWMKWNVLIIYSIVYVISYLLNPLIHFRPLPYLGFCKLCCNENGGADIFPDPHFISFGYIHKSGISGSCNSFIQLWGISILFSTVAAPAYLPPTAHNGSLYSASSPTCLLCFDDSHSNNSEEISLCGFDLHFPSD